MKMYWEQLNDRERLLVLLASVCTLLFLMYVLMYAPLVSSVAKSRESLTEKRATLLWMQAAQQSYAPEKTPQSVTTSNLLSIMTEQLRQASFHHFSYQLEQTASEEIQLTFVEVPYQSFLTWLAMQSQRYTLTIKRLSLNKTKYPGVVQATVIFAVV